MPRPKRPSGALRLVLTGAGVAVAGIAVGIRRAGWRVPGSGLVPGLARGVTASTSSRLEETATAITPDASPEPDPPAASGPSEGQTAASDVDDLAELTRDELYEKAKELDIDGRSKMNKAELLAAVAEEDDA
jgi:hypothetical protein